MAIPSWVISSTYLLPISGSNLVHGVGSMVGSLSLISAPVHTIYTLTRIYAHGILCTHRTRHVHQRSGSGNDNTQLAKGCCRPSRQKVIYLLRQTCAYDGWRARWVESILGSHPVRSTVPGTQEACEQIDRDAGEYGEICVVTGEGDGQVSGESYG